MSRVECLIYGALGGMCPTIAKLAGFYSTKPESALPEIGVLIGLGLFALLGAIIASGFGANEVRAAIVAGIAAPAIISNVVAGVANEAGKAAQPPAGSTFLLGVSPAYAQSDDIGTGRVLDTQLYGGNRVIQLSPSVKGGLPANLNLTVEAIVTGNGEQSQLPIGTISGETNQTLVLPEGTTAIQIGSQTVPVSDAEQLNVTIETAPTFTGDLLWALGGKRTYDIRDIQIAPQ